MTVRVKAIFALPPYVISAIVYGSLFALMSVSLTLTYITTKVPNFAQGALVTAGLYTGFALLQHQQINPYESLPLSFLVGGSSRSAMYLLVLRPLSRRGASIISLMIATLAVDIVFVGIFGIYSDYLYQVKEVYDAKLFYALTSADFTLFGVNGVVYAAPTALALTTIGLYLVLTRTRFGLAMRATVENPNLAKVVGVNTEVVYVTSWFIAGGLAAIAGVFYSLWQGGEPDIGSILLISMFAGQHPRRPQEHLRSGGRRARRRRQRDTRHDLGGAVHGVLGDGLRARHSAARNGRSRCSSSREG